MLEGAGTVGMLASCVCVPPAVQGRGLCQPPGEPPALQLVGGLLCLPQSSSTGQWQERRDLAQGQQIQDEMPFLHSCITGAIHINRLHNYVHEVHLSS